MRRIWHFFFGHEWGTPLKDEIKIRELKRFCSCGKELWVAETVDGFTYWRHV